MIMVRQFSKDFILFLIGTAQASFGAAVSTVALSFLVLKITGSASAMSITLALKILPVIFMPFISTFIDRINLKVPLIIGFFLRSILLLGLCVGLQFGLINISGIYVIALFSGIIETMNFPAAMVLIPYLLKNMQLERGNSLLAIANQGMSFAGYLVGGIMVGFIGAVHTLLLEGASYLIMAVLLFFIVMPKAKTKSINSFWQDFTLGINLVRNSKVLLLITISFLLINASIAPIQVLMPVHMMAIGYGAKGYGVFMSLVVGGLLLGNMFIAYLGERFNKLTGIILGWFGYSVAFGGLAALNSFHISLLWAVILGISSAKLNTGITVIIQKIIPDDLRGRVVGIISTVAQVGIPISFFMLSLIIKKITMAEIFFVNMILAILFVIFWSASRQLGGFCQNLVRNQN